jgi:hypothetical protein
MGLETRHDDVPPRHALIFALTKDLTNCINLAHAPTSAGFAQPDGKSFIRIQFCTAG